MNNMSLYEYMLNKADHWNEYNIADELENECDCFDREQFLDIVEQDKATTEREQTILACLHCEVDSIDEEKCIIYLK